MSDDARWVRRGSHLTNAEADKGAIDVLRRSRKTSIAPLSASAFVRWLPRRTQRASSDMNEDAQKCDIAIEARNDERVADLLAGDLPRKAIDRHNCCLGPRPSHAIGDGCKDLVAGAAFLVPRDEGLTRMNCLLRRGNACETDARTFPTRLGADAGECG